MVACGPPSAGRGGTGRRRQGGTLRHTGAWKQSVRQFLFGVTGYEVAQQALELRASMETLFMLVSFGDMVGLPILPPYYGLRLLPHVVPSVQSWKRRLLRERELGDDHEYHLHGL